MTISTRKEHCIHCITKVMTFCFSWDSAFSSSLSFYQSAQQSKGISGPTILQSWSRWSLAALYQLLAFRLPIYSSIVVSFMCMLVSFSFYFKYQCKHSHWNVRTKCNGVINVNQTTIIIRLSFFPKQMICFCGSFNCCGLSIL